MRPELILILFFSALAHGEHFSGPISKASGGAGRAGLQGMESAFINPALVPLLKASEMAVYFHDGYIGRQQHRNAYGIGIVDSGKEVLFPGAAHYVRTHDTGRSIGGASGELWHLAFGKNVTNRLAVGASAYRLVYDVERDRGYTQWNGSLGLLALITENIGVAYVLDNLAKPGSEVPRGLREDMRQGLGFYGLVADLARIRADVSRLEKHNPEHKLTYALALETMTSPWLLFRGGFKRDELADTRFWTTGFGFNGPRLRVDYAFEKNAKGTGGAVHSVDLSVPF